MSLLVGDEEALKVEGLEVVGGPRGVVGRAAPFGASGLLRGGGLGFGVVILCFMGLGGMVGGRIGKNQNGMYVHVAMALITYLHPQNDVGVVLLMRMWGGGSSEE